MNSYVGTEQVRTYSLGTDVSVQATPVSIDLTNKVYHNIFRGFACMAHLDKFRVLGQFLTLGIHNPVSKQKGRKVSYLAIP